MENYEKGKVGGIILAAGTDRIEDTIKARITTDGNSIIKNEISILRKAEVSSIVIILGQEAENIEKHLIHRRVTCLKNPNYNNSEMIESVKLGIKELSESCEKFLLLPVDIPAISEKTIRGIIEANEADVIIPTYRGAQGHPILLNQKAGKAILKFKGNGGVREAIKSKDLVVKEIQTKDPGILLEINEKKDQQKAEKIQQKRRLDNPLEVDIDIVFSREKEFLDSKMIDLLKKISQSGSINQTCKEEKIAYSKAWTLINLAEEQLGTKLLERQSGGKRGGQSSLTENGKKILNAYSRTKEKAKKETEKLEKEIREILK